MIGYSSSPIGYTNSNTLLNSQSTFRIHIYITEHISSTYWNTPTVTVSVLLNCNRMTTRQRVLNHQIPAWWPPNHLFPRKLLIVESSPSRKWLLTTSQRTPYKRGWNITLPKWKKQNKTPNFRTGTGSTRSSSFLSLSFNREEWTLTISQKWDLSAPSNWPLWTKENISPSWKECL